MGENLTYSWEFPVELGRTDDTGHQTLVITEKRETSGRRRDDSVKQSVTVEAGVLDDTSAFVHSH
jgi:hypothetical protein